MTRNFTDDEISKLLTDWESQQEELLEDVVGSVDCESGLINNNNNNSDQLQIAIPFSIIVESGRFCARFKRYAYIYNKNVNL